MEHAIVIVSHPTGNPFSASVAAALYDEDLLAAFYTCVSWRPESPFARLVPRSIKALLERRARVQLPSQVVHTRPVRELIRSVLLRSGKRHLVTGETKTFSIDGVYRDLDRHVSSKLDRFPGLRAVYAYEDGALTQFERARAMGLTNLYDLPIGYWRVNREVSLEEAERQPAWRGTLNALGDSDDKLERKDREIGLADTIFVASTFTKSTLRASPNATEKIVVIPYGTPAPIDRPRAITQEKDPIRVLYVGSLTQRKGISYLFEAADKLGKLIALTVIGRKVGTSEALDKNCAAHRWIESLPHAEILAEMRRNDVLVFPSLFEGFGLVIGEALSQGLPVITTPHTGGPDILREGVDGFIVPIRDADAIAARILQLHDDRALLERMSESARQRAGELSWKNYEANTAQAVAAAIA